MRNYIALQINSQFTKIQKQSNTIIEAEKLAEKLLRTANYLPSTQTLDSKNVRCYHRHTFSAFSVYVCLAEPKTEPERLNDPTTKRKKNIF